MDDAKDVPSEMSPEEQRRKRRAERQAQVQPPSSGGKGLIGRLIESQKRMVEGHRRLLAAIAQAHVELMRTSAEIAVDFFKGLEPPVTPQASDVKGEATTGA